MKKLSTWQIAFSTLLLAVLVLSGSAAFAKADSPPCAWQGNCPPTLCGPGPTGPPVGTCSEFEPCSNCFHSYCVYMVDGKQCKASCDD